MDRASAARLPDGRLHLHHGPIDLIVTIEGEGRAGAEAALIARFDHVLEDLVGDLPTLRAPTHPDTRVGTGVAQRMVDATAPFCPDFITPMAAVAGAVADEMCETIARCAGISRAIVNNGGDIALLLSSGQRARVAMAGGGSLLTLGAHDPWRGVATSGWRGRSWSRGIADAVTVVARNAAAADAAATMIANRVDLPGHRGIGRSPANALSADSDLGARLVTTAVPLLTLAEADTALSAGAAHAAMLLRRGLIGGAALFLQGRSRLIGAPITLLSKDPTKEVEHA